MAKSRVPRVTLIVRPRTKRESPKWWPLDDNGTVLWITLHEDGWTAGIDKSVKIPTAWVSKIKKDWREDHPKRHWYFVELCEESEKGAKPPKEAS